MVINIVVRDAQARKQLPYLLGTELLEPRPARESPAV
jgi:hypothetical protein